MTWRRGEIEHTALAVDFRFRLRYSSEVPTFQRFVG